MLSQKKGATRFFNPQRAVLQDISNKQGGKIDPKKEARNKSKAFAILLEGNDVEL